jgi:tetratricopeptide (TPR) repeat protein
MGAVYEATQDRPRRRVALKIMSRGLISVRARQRFDYESEALGKLRHPAIAQVFESGVHDPPGGGLPVPYFAMELVDGGVPITSYADRVKLDRGQRLALFARLCDAIEHGHRAGIVHRDIKPANVLVDGGGDVKVIDFGVARVLSLEDESAHTMTTEQPVGTLQYMAPEQLGSRQIDPRADVYALGMLLHELMTGEPPYSVRGQSVAQAARVISSHELADPARRFPQLGRDLAAIIVRAIAKDPARRYNTAAELAADIERSSRGEPVSARALTLGYQVAVLARRHKAAVAMASAIAIGVTLGIGAGVAGLYVGYRDARAAQASATAAADRASGTAQILRAMIMQANPKNAGGEPRMRDALDAARAWLDEGASPPLVEFDVREAIAQGYWTLGDFTGAREQFELALDLGVRYLGGANNSVQCAAASLAELLIFLEHHGDALDALDRVSPNGTPDTVLMMLNARAAAYGATGNNAASLDAATEAMSVAREAFGDRSEHYASALKAASNAAGLLGNRELATSYARELSALYDGPLALDAATADLVRAEVAVWMSHDDATAEELAQAEALLRRSIASAQARDPMTLDHAWFHRQLGHLLIRLERPGDAVDAYTEALRIAEAVLGADHHQVHMCRLGLAKGLAATGRLDDAADAFRGAVEGLLADLGPEHPITRDAIAAAADAGVRTVIP